MDTWYVLEDGSFADPADVIAGDDGILMHKGGVAVAYGPHGPRSRAMSAEEIEAYRTREMKPEPAMEPEKPRRNYKTRGTY